MVQKRQKKKVITIGNLAVTTQKEFLAINHRFDKVDKDMAGLKSEVEMELGMK